MGGELEAPSLGASEYRACVWCEKPVNQDGTRFPRPFCKAAHLGKAVMVAVIVVAGVVRALRATGAWDWIAEVAGW